MREGGLFPVLGPDEPSPSAVAEAIERLLSDEGLRQQAQVLADEMAAAAPPPVAAALVERVVETGEPLRRPGA
jgi:UDP:flavonoid glycosyltransferase YjiC (YdhE family)